MFVFDAHLDLSMNALEWNRDLTQPLENIRQREIHKTDKPDRGLGTVSFEEMRRGNIGICVATQIARYVKPENPLSGWNSQAQAWAQTQGQLAWYKVMEDAGELIQIRTAAELTVQLNKWQNKTANEKLPIGYVLSLEGADSIVDLSYLDKAHANGLRALGPAHYGPGEYAFGTDSTGKFPQKGLDLLDEMDELNMILDVTHLSDDCMEQAFSRYKGPIWASHHLTRAITPHNRQIPDHFISEIIDRNGFIGMAFDAWMIVPNWKRGKSTPQNMNLTIDSVIDHLDHVCQLAGNANHVGIGSDLDGGFGREQCPSDVETIADLQKIPALLQKRGYTETDIENIMWRNGISFLERALP
ncbi:MAG: dipeptidase [Spirosomaceae bacterium]|nr:dipeptidase [Spirosomataceae bacterium]